MTLPLPQCQTGRIHGKILLWLGGVFVLAALLVFGSFHSHRSKADAALAEKIAELESAGISTTLEEVNRRYHEHGRDPAGNAAPLYEQAFAHKVIDEAGRDELVKAVSPGNGEPLLEAETLQVIANLVSANGDAIQLLKEAAAMPYLRSDLDLTQAPLALPPYSGKMREGGRLLAGEAIIAAEAGDSQRATDAVLAIFRIAYHLGEEPVLVSQLARIVLEYIGRVALERTLERVELPPAALASLQEKLYSLEKGPRLEASFETELAMADALFEQMAGSRDLPFEEKFSEWQKPWFTLHRVRGTLAKNHHFHLTQMEKVLGIVQLPIDERVRYEWPSESEFSGNSIGELLGAILIPTLSRVVESDNRGVICLRVSRIALAAEQYRMEHGHFPARQEVLVPDYLEEIPTDPYVEENRFRFVSEAGAFIVRSDGVFGVVNQKENLVIQFQLPVR